MSTANPGLNVEDIHVPKQEPSTPVDRSPYGEQETHQELTAEIERQKLASGSAPAQLPWWLAEKYFWVNGNNGGQFLRPYPEYLMHAMQNARAAALAGAESIRNASEADLVKQLGPEVQAVEQSLRAINELDAVAFQKFLVQRCLRNAVYAATTEFELIKWAENSAAKGQDPEDHNNYGEKRSRAVKFARTAGALFLLLKDIDPTVDLSEAVFVNMAKSVVYDTARMEANKLRTPATASKSDGASAQAAKMTAKLF